MIGTVRSALCISTDLIFLTVLRIGPIFNHHFTDEETEVHSS